MRLERRLYGADGIRWINLCSEILETSKPGVFIIDNDASLIHL